MFDVTPHLRGYKIYGDDFSARNSATNFETPDYIYPENRREVLGILNTLTKLLKLHCVMAMRVLPSIPTQIALTLPGITLMFHATY